MKFYRIRHILLVNKKASLEGQLGLAMSNNHYCIMNVDNLHSHYHPELQAGLMTATPEHRPFILPPEGPPPGMALQLAKDASSFLEAAKPTGLFTSDRERIAREFVAIVDGYADARAEQLELCTRYSPLD